MKPIIAALAFVAAPALAQEIDLITSADPESVLKAMQQAGYIAVIETDDYGEPAISSKVSLSNFSVYFFDCTKGRDCTSVEFSAGFGLSKPIDAEKINRWNRENRFAHAFVDEAGNPVLRMDLVLEAPGVATENFGITLDYWRILLEDFERFIGWR